ncbi:MAG: hypothetical protein LC105_07755 [Chitinophagales bacterium]|nr:hypothetical protein [Chitinophagales bacterium]MCZ2393732.1 hypothetical protein [Chitinophagales bacterium]
MIRYIGIWVFFFCIAVFNLKAQEEILVPIQNHQVFSLDAKGSSFFTGKYTTVLEIELPVNTIRWYYRYYNLIKKENISKFSGENAFLESLDKKINSKRFYPNDLPSIPSNLTQKLNFYLLKSSEQSIIFQKQFTTAKFEFVDEFSSLNLSSAWKEVCDPEYIFGKQFIGIENLGIFSGTNIVVDIVAICKKRSLSESGWSEEFLKNIEDSLMDNMALRTDIPTLSYSKVSDCFMNTLQQKFDFKVFQNFSSDIKSSVQSSIFDNCFNNRMAKIGNDTITALSPYMIIGKWKTEKGEVLEFKFSKVLNLTRKDGQSIKGSWYLADNGLYLRFEGYKTQKYLPIILTSSKYVWKNPATGNYLRYTKIVQ